MFPVVCCNGRASDISRKKKQNFAGFSGANSRKNRPILRDFRGKKSKFAKKISRFRGVFAGEKSKFAEKSADFEGFCRKKSKFEAFSGANAQKNRPLSREISGETSTSPRNNQ